MYDHNHENMQERIQWFSHQQNCYRKKEFCIKWFVIGDFVFFVSWYLGVNITFAFYLS